MCKIKFVQKYLKSIYINLHILVYTDIIRFVILFCFVLHMFRPSIRRSIPPRGYKKLRLTVQHCKGVNYLEHVQAKITLTSQRRGDIEIYLISPAGTNVTLLTSR